ncbi:MAG: hypothetical protein ACYTKD_25565, partial [Planctomycetota bacterium]
MSINILKMEIVKETTKGGDQFDSVGMVPLYSSAPKVEFTSPSDGTISLDSGYREAITVEGIVEDEIARTAENEEAAKPRLKIGDEEVTLE